MRRNCAPYGADGSIHTGNRMSLRFALVAALATLVAACTSNPLEVVISRCPAIAVLGDTGTLVQFAGEGRTNQDVTSISTIGNLQIECQEGSSVESQISFRIDSSRGPAGTDSSLPLQYFVAVIKDNHQIITKEVYDVTQQFDGNGLARTSEVVALTIPTIEQARRYNYEFIVGFQMSDEQAAYNITR